MRAWHGRTSDGTYELRIELDVIAQLERWCRDAADVETGGILIGHYSDDLHTAIIVEATGAPPDSRGGATWFDRGTRGLRALLARRWRGRSRTHYVGEWHFHPAQAVVPSGIDFTQMAQIAKSADYQCSEPILIICAGVHGAPCHLRAYVCPLGSAPRELLANPIIMSRSKENQTDKIFE